LTISLLERRSPVSTEGGRISCTVTLAAILALTLVPGVTAGESYLNFPDIHGNTIVFSCEGDLWSVPATGGLAKRLTQGDGLEYMAKFSPDGEYIAFTGEYDHGGNDVYIMSATGGMVERLTFHPWSEYVLTWAPDGESIVFRSMRHSAHYTYQVFTIAADGGFPKPMDLGEVSLISFAPDGKRIAFNRFSREFRTWKRYKGGLAQDIWVGNPETMEFNKITAYEGTDAFPMWIGERVYFVSDRDRTMNIHSMRPDGGDVRQHTFHDEYDVRWPSPGGNRIVYHNGGDIWLLDTGSGDYAKVDIEVPSDRTEEREHFINPVKYITDFEVSPKGRRVAFCARGELVAAPAKEGRLIGLTATSGVREKSPRWSADGKELAYISEATGEEEIYVVDALGKDEPEQITKGTKGWKYPPVWSPDGKKLAYSDGSQTVFVVNRETGRITAADSSDYWEIKKYAWSPDSRYLAYSKHDDHRFSSIFIYDTEERKVIRVTEGFTDDTEPVWDPEGKYLYFLSDRTINPVLGKIAFGVIRDKATKPYLVMLESGQKSPFFPSEPEDEDEDAAENGKKDKDDKKEKDGEEEEGVEVKIDVEGLMDRVVEFPVDAGHYSDLTAAEGKIFYRSRPSLGMAEGQRRGSEAKPLHNVHMYDIEEEEEETILSGINAYRLSPDGKKLIYKRMNDYFVVDAGKGAGDADDDAKVDLSGWHIRLDPRLEWQQIFNEGWRLQRDFYWAPNMAEIDWAGIKAKYEKLLPRIASRNDLTDLVGELIAELSTSHTYIWGGDIKRPDRIPVGMLGADVVADETSGYYRLEKVYPPEPSSPDAVSPLTLSHAGVKGGDYVLAVNGRPLTTSTNFYSAFLNLAGEEVLLSVNDKPSRQGTRDVIVKAIRDESGLRYLEWVRSKREYVAEQTGGRIGYLHIPDMGTSGLVEFQRTFYPQLEKPGLIVDARYNGGGFVSELIIRALSVDLLAYGKPRKGKPYPYPDDAVHGHKVVVTNEHAGSDGDIFPRAFKLAKLGPVIGTRTWGGVVGIRMDKPFIDGGLMTIPEFAWWEDEGWTLENKGAEPDVEIDNLPAGVIRGRDDQLDKAIEVVTEMLERDPRERPALPDYPNKRK
jgi:tricorn protease